MGDDGSTSTTLEFVLPNEIREKDVYHRDALFGAPFASSPDVYGEVVYIPGDACDRSSYEKVLGVYKEDEHTLPRIFMVNRGECKFATKTRLAQDFNGAGLIVINNKCLEDTRPAMGAGVDERWPERLHSQFCPANEIENTLPFMSFENEALNIKIPAFLIKKLHGQRLRNCYFNSKGVTQASDLAETAQGNDKLKTAYGGLEKEFADGFLSTACEKDKKVVVKFNLDVPQAQDNVKWQLWMNPDKLPEDLESIAKMARRISDHSTFEPNYLLQLPMRYGCTRADSCSDLCIGSGAGFCPVSPSIQSKGATGKDIVKEAIRQKCLFNQVDDIHDSLKALSHQIWWNYVRAMKGCQDEGKEVFQKCQEIAEDYAKCDKSALQNCVDSELKGDDLKVLKAMFDKQNRYTIFKTAFVVNDIRQDFGVTGVFLTELFCDGISTKPGLCNCQPWKSQPDVLEKCLEQECYKTQDKQHNCPGTTLCVRDLDECVAPPVDPGAASGSSGSSAVTTIFIVLLVAGVLAAGFVVMQKRQRRQLNEEVRDILSEYVPIGAGAMDNFSGGRASEDAVGVI